jgi:EpsI family protein
MKGQRGTGGTLRFLLIVVLLAATAAFLHAHRTAEVVPKSEPLSSFPLQIDSWSGYERPISDGILAVLGPGKFLSRVYTQSGQPFVEFFLAYFPSQQTGDTIHSPKNCLPGSGWTPLESSKILLSGPNGQAIPANRYIIQKGTDRQLVIYWYQAHGRAVASEYWARFYLMADAIRMNRTDGALIRIITPVVNGSEGDAEGRARDFAKQILPSLDSYVPL